MRAAIGAFYALWHGVPPEVSQEFELAHTREHLLDHLGYLGPDANLWARRCGDGKGTLPPYFALYGMSGLECLRDPANADRRTTLSAWFAPLRAVYRDRTGHHCRVLATAGAGMGGALATFIFDLTEQPVPARAAHDLVHTLIQRPALTAAHLGQVDWSVPPAIGLPLPQREADAPERGVLVVESFDRTRLACDVDHVAEALLRSGVATRVRGSSHYDLSYAMDYDDLVRVRPFERPSVGA